MIFRLTLRVGALILLVGAGAGAAIAANTLPSTWELSDGRRELQALIGAYPARIGGLNFSAGEASIEVGGRRYWWSRGRILPASERANYADYQSIRFYPYYRGAARQIIVPPEREQYLRTLFDGRPPDTVRRSNAFLDTLYGISSRADAERIITRTNFLGQQVNVHPFLLNPLTRVEAAIRYAAARDPGVREYLGNLESISGYHWRTISGTAVRSYHAYGIAVDLLSNDYQGQHVYWRWSAEWGISDWWAIPIAERWAPPQAIIDAFEDNGFVWGGKWLFFDNLHFEYRPEILRLAAAR